MSTFAEASGEEMQQALDRRATLQTSYRFEDQDRQSDEKPILDDPSNIHCERTGLPNQEEDGHVERECHHCITEEDGDVKVHLHNGHALSTGHTSVPLFLQLSKIAVG